MRIKKLIASIMACVLLMMNLSAVCFAAGNEVQESTGASEAEASAGIVEDSGVMDEDKEQDNGKAPAGDMAEGGDGAIAIPFDSIEDFMEVFSETNDEEQEPTTTTGKVNVSRSSYLHLRNGSGMEYDIIGHLFSGDELEIIGEEGDWYQVVVKERTGYVYKDYVDVEEPAAAESKADDDMLALLMFLMMAGMGAEGEGDSSDALTPDGNLTLVDDYSEEHADGTGKQFITVTTKDGNYFYLVIDRDEDGEENVHFLNLVDEADLLALMEEDEAAKYAPPVETETPSEAEPAEPVEEEPKEEPEKESGTNVLSVLILVIALTCGGGAFAFTKLKGNQKKKETQKPDPDADYVDGEDDEGFELPDEVIEEDDESTLFDADDNEPV